MKFNCHIDGHKVYDYKITNKDVFLNGEFCYIHPVENILARPDEVPSLQLEGVCRNCKCVIKTREEVEGQSYWLVHAMSKQFDEAVAMDNNIKEPKCPRCGDMYYHPKTEIENQRQRAAEWEEVAVKAKEQIEELEEDLKRLKIETANRSEAMQICQWINNKNPGLVSLAIEALKRVG